MKSCPQYVVKFKKANCENSMFYMILFYQKFSVKFMFYKPY